MRGNPITIGAGTEGPIRLINAQSGPSERRHNLGRGRFVVLDSISRIQPPTHGLRCATLEALRPRDGASLGHNLLHHISLHIREPEVAAGVSIGELLVVEAE